MQTIQLNKTIISQVVLVTVMIIATVCILNVTINITIICIICIVLVIFRMFYCIIQRNFKWSKGSSINESERVDDYGVDEVARISDLRMKESHDDRNDGTNCNTFVLKCTARAMKRHSTRPVKDERKEEFLRARRSRKEERELEYTFFEQ